MFDTEQTPRPIREAPFRLIAVMASMGGLPAMEEVVAGLPAEFPTPVVVLQHRTPTADDWLPRLLRRRSAVPVEEAREDDLLLTPGIRVVPGGMGAVVRPGGRLGLVREPDLQPGNGLLCSMAAAMGPAGCAVILSGKLRDGARGASAVKASGGRVLVQEPGTARAPDMPMACCAAGAVDFVLPPRLIGKALVALVMAPGGADLLRVPVASWALYGA
jgi:two-component system chemotaxis response regulator CheB